MDILNVSKIIAAIITVVFGLIASIIELRKNPEYWLNRWFALFFSSTAIGFLLYTIYHFITMNASLIIPIMISAHIFINFGLVSLLMTVFILDYSEKIAMNSKYIGFIIVLFIISIFGYFIWTPTVNMEQFAQGIVDTETPLGWFIYVNVLRLMVFIYILYKYAIISRRIEGIAKKRVNWFFIGSIIEIVGIILNLIGGIVHSVPIEIIGLIAIDIGIIATVNGFLIE